MPAWPAGSTPGTSTPCVGPSRPPRDAASSWGPIRRTPTGRDSAAAPWTSAPARITEEVLSQVAALDAVAEACGTGGPLREAPRRALSPHGRRRGVCSGRRRRRHRGAATWCCWHRPGPTRVEVAESMGVRVATEAFADRGLPARRAPGAPRPAAGRGDQRSRRGGRDAPSPSPSTIRSPPSTGPPSTSWHRRSASTATPRTRRRWPSRVRLALEGARGDAAALRVVTVSVVNASSGRCVGSGTARSWPRSASVRDAHGLAAACHRPVPGVGPASRTSWSGTGRSSSSPIPRVADLAAMAHELAASSRPHGATRPRRGRWRSRSASTAPTSTRSPAWPR